MKTDIELLFLTLLKKDIKKQNQTSVIYFYHFIKKKKRHFDFCIFFKWLTKLDGETNREGKGAAELGSSEAFRRLRPQGT